MKLKLTLAALLCSISATGFAAEPTIKCPDISALKSGQFTKASAVYDSNLWEVHQTANLYGTENSWQFKVNIEAEDKDNAMKLASATMEAMKLISGPEKIENQWMCHYRSGQHDAVAILTLPAGEQSTVASVETDSKKKPA